jgi:hypothetical protein
MRKEGLSTDTTFEPCWFLLDYTFKFHADSGFAPKPLESTVYPDRSLITCNRIHDQIRRIANEKMTKMIAVIEESVLFDNLSTNPPPIQIQF